MLWYVGAGAVCYVVAIYIYLYNTAGGNVLSIVSNTVILQFFDAVGWVTEGHPTCKNFSLQNPCMRINAQLANLRFPGK